MNYYISINNRPIKISEEKYHEIYGTDETRGYIKSVYRGQTKLSDVPEEYQEAVALGVELQTRLFGTYEDTISDSEFVQMLQEALE